jgi:vancomycin permeability regulator SanA
MMERTKPDYSCVVVTSNFHVFRAAMIARRTGVNGQVTGARTAGYYWPTATIREFGAVFLTYKVINLGICLLIVALPLAYVLLRPHI